MKRLLYIILLLATAYTITGCMHNGGDIGHLFGQWRLEYIDSNQGTEPCDTVFFSFQSDVFQVRKVIYNTYDYVGFIGQYEQDEEHIKFNFYNHNGSEVTTPEATEKMLVDLASLHITTTSPLFKIIKLQRNEMILEHESYQYYFTKLN